MLKVIAFTMVVPVALVTVICAAISFFALCLLAFGELARSSALIGTVVPRRALARSLLDISLAIGCLKEASSEAMT
jgi:hypothetical protein